MHKSKQIFKYLLADLLAAMLAWALFYLYRKYEIEASLNAYNFVFKPDKNFYLGITVLPIAWVIVYALMGTYNDIYRKSRLKEIALTLYISIFGVLVIFFSLLLDDIIVSYKNY